MQTTRRELLSLVLIGLCSLAAVRAGAQVEGADGDSGGALKQARQRGVHHVQSLSDQAGRLITLALHQATMKEALRAIARQAEVRLIYNDSDLPADRLVTVTISDVTVEQALALVLRGTELQARRTDGGVAIEPRIHSERSERRTLQASLSGRVTDVGNGRPIVGVAVRLDELSLATSTDADGAYRFTTVPAGTYTLIARRVGYEMVTKDVSLADGEQGRADIAMAPSPTILDQVVTTGTIVPTEVKALPNPISVITADQIERQRPVTLTSILRQAVPTAVAFSNPTNPTATQISVRGASSLNGAGEMKIFVDGVEATNYAFAPVDPASIDRIEIVRGPQAATIYGADAAGGVIEIFTKRGESTTHPVLNVRGALGIVQTPYDGFASVPRQAYSGSVRGGGQNVSYNFGGSYSHLGDYLPEGEISRQSAGSIYGGMHLVGSLFDADISARYLDNDDPQVSNPLLRDAGYLPLSPPSYMRTNTLDEAMGARLTVAPVGWWRNQLTLGVSRHTTRVAQAKPRYTTADDSLLTLSNSAARKVSVGYNASVTGRISSELSGSMSVGIDHYSQEVDALSTGQALNVEGPIATSPPGSLSGSLVRQTNTGYFAQGQLGIRDAVYLTAGVRAEDNSGFGVDYGMAVLPRAGLTFVRDLGAITAKLRVSYGRALRTPAAGEALGSATSTSILLRNPLLAAEKQQGWDGGLDLAFGNRGSFNITAFTQTATDLISFLQVAADPLPTYQYRNIGRIGNTGFEVEASFTPATWLELRGQYGYVHSRIEAVGAAGGSVEVGDAPRGVPTHTAGVALTVTPMSGTTANVALTYVGDFRAIDWLVTARCLADFSPATCPESFLSTFSFRSFVQDYRGFAKANVSITRRINGRVKAFLAVDNLTNAQVSEPDNYFPVVGRSSMLGVEVTY